MSSATSGRQIFENPPIDEVALAVQFDPQTVDSMVAARFRDALKEDFPKRNEQVARPPMGEDFVTPPGGPPVRFEVLGIPSMPRFWFLSGDEALLVQVQHDLVAYNWRRRSVEAAYPGYEAVRGGLEGVLAQLAEILSADDEREAGLTPNWCEVTYINQIGPDPGSAERPPLNRVMRGFNFPSPQGFLPLMEDSQINARFLIPGDDAPRGRLNVSVTSGIRSDTSGPIWAITLTARIRATDHGIDGALNTLDDGHEWAVNCFEELTSDEMHAHWHTKGGST